MLGTENLVFRVDTAAERTILYQSAAFLLDLDMLPLKSQRIYTATGFKSFPVFRAPALSAFGRAFALGEIVALPDPRDGSAVGIIGTDFLAGHILHIRASTGEIGALPADADFAPSRMTRLRGFAVARGAIALTVRIGDLDVPAIIDTGASESVLNSALIRQLSRLTPDHIPEVEDTERLSLEAGAGTLRGRRGRLKAIIMGPQTYRDVPVVVADLPIFTLLGARQAPAMIMGMDLLGRQDFAVDFQRYELWVETPTLAPDQNER